LIAGTAWVVVVVCVVVDGAVAVGAIAVGADVPGIGASIDTAGAAGADDGGIRDTGDGCCAAADPTPDSKKINANPVCANPVCARRIAFLFIFFDPVMIHKSLLSLQ
jgi:hypothetical protein